MSVLLLDIGNSRCKWGMWQDGAIAQTGTLANEMVADPARWRFARDVTAVFASNVASADTAMSIDTALREATGLTLSLAKVSHEDAGVRCAYQDTTRLGVDRWMAVLCMSRRANAPALVVDAGTAMTIDAVDKGTQHLGGLILPGLKLMQRSLTQSTAGIRVDTAQPPRAAFGTTTSDAVRNGALIAAMGAVRQAASVLGYQDLSDCPLLITGGDGAPLADALALQDRFEPTVVLQGLAIYAGLAT
ncbi:MAG: type III pantothenate kinase [Pseudomonadota bacterium]